MMEKQKYFLKKCQSNRNIKKKKNVGEIEILKQITT